MVYIDRVYVIHTTAGFVDANTDAGFELKIQGPGVDLRANFEDLPHNERERGRTDQYAFNVLDENNAPLNWDPTELTISMRMISTHDGWLPSSIFVIGRNIEDHADYVLMGAHTHWPHSQRFDRGDPNAVAEHVISGFSG